MAVAGNLVILVQAKTEVFDARMKRAGTAMQLFKTRIETVGVTTNKVFDGMARSARKACADIEHTIKVSAPRWSTQMQAAWNAGQTQWQKQKPGKAAKGMSPLAMMGGAFATAYVGQAAYRNTVGLAAEFEQTQISFDVLLKSGEKANKLLSEVRKFANETPFEFEELSQGSKLLLAYGESAETVVDTLRRLGDLSSAFNVSILDVARVYGKARVQGRVFARDMHELTNIGINIRPQLAKQLKIPVEDLNQAVSEGLVHFEHIQQAIKDMTSAGGQFFNMTSRQAHTLNGELSTLKDELKDIGRTVGGTVVPVLNSAVQSLNKMLQAATGGGPEITITPDNVGAHMDAFTGGMDKKGHAAWLAKSAGMKAQIRQESMWYDSNTETMGLPRAKELRSMYARLERQEAVVLRSMRHAPGGSAVSDVLQRANSALGLNDRVARMLGAPDTSGRAPANVAAAFGGRGGMGNPAVWSRIFSGQSGQDDIVRKILFAGGGGDSQVWQRIFNGDGSGPSRFPGLAGAAVRGSTEAANIEALHRGAGLKPLQQIEKNTKQTAHGFAKLVAAVEKLIPVGELNIN